MRQFAVCTSLTLICAVNFRQKKCLLCWSYIILPSNQAAFSIFPMIPWGSLTMGLTSLLARKCRWQLLCIMYADLLRSRVHANYHCVRIIEAYLNISLLPVSNRLRGSEGDNYTNTHISRSAPTPMRLHAPTPWAGIGSLSLQLNQTLVDSDQSEQYILLDTLLAGIISYIIDFHQRTQRLTERGFRKCNFFQNPSCSFPLNFKVQTHKLQSLGLNMAIELSRGTSGQSPL